MTVYNLYRSNKTNRYYLASGTNKYQDIETKKVYNSIYFGNGELWYIGTGSLKDCQQRIEADKVSRSLK